MKMMSVKFKIIMNNFFRKNKIIYNELKGMPDISQGIKKISCCFSGKKKKYWKRLNNQFRRGIIDDITVIEILLSKFWCF